MELNRSPMAWIQTYALSELLLFVPLVIPDGVWNSGIPDGHRWGGYIEKTCLLRTGAQ